MPAKGLRRFLTMCIRCFWVLDVLMHHRAGIPAKRAAVTLLSHLHRKEVPGVVVGWASCAEGTSFKFAHPPALWVLGVLIHPIGRRPSLPSQRAFHWPTSQRPQIPERRGQSNGTLLRPRHGTLLRSRHFAAASWPTRTQASSPLPATTPRSEPRRSHDAGAVVAKTPR